MEDLNKIQLRGRVGYAKTTRVQDSDCTRFALATNYAYHDADGNAIIETTWWDCYSFDPDAANLKRGDSVEVTGRLRVRRYTKIDGSECTQNEVFASTFHRILTPAEIVASRV